MVFADDIRRMILKIAEERGPDQAFRPSDVAQRVDSANWQTLVDQVSFVASVLEREGKIRRRLSVGQVDFLKIEDQTSKKKIAPNPVIRSAF
jgi:hypothetical protein